MTERLIDYRFHGNGLFHCLCEQWHGIGDAPTHGVCRTQSYSNPEEIDRQVRVLTDAPGPFEPEERPGQVAVA